MFDEIRAKTTALNEQIAVLRKEAADQTKPLLQEFMREHPQVKQIKWAQYTPYFNDGDPCVSGVSDFGFFFEGDDLDVSHYEGDLPWRGYSPEWEKASVCSKETYDACLSLAKELGGMDDVLETLFGDHVQVSVTPDGVSVDEYDHD
jgi:hypothetical protein